MYNNREQHKQNQLTRGNQYFDSQNSQWRQGNRCREDRDCDDRRRENRWREGDDNCDCGRENRDCHCNENRNNNDDCGNCYYDPQTRQWRCYQPKPCRPCIVCATGATGATDTVLYAQLY